MAIFGPKQLPKPSNFFSVFIISRLLGVYSLSFFYLYFLACSVLVRQACFFYWIKMFACLFAWSFIYFFGHLLDWFFFFLFFFFKVIASLIFMHLWYPCVLYVQIPILMSIFVCPPSIHVMWGLYVCRVVKIMIWILQSYDFMIPPAQNDLDLSRIFAIVQDRYDRTILTISNDFGF